MKACVNVILLLLVSLFLFLPQGLVAQTSGGGGLSSSGTDYWLGFMPNGPPPGSSSVYQELFIATGVDNKVTVYVGNSALRTISLTAGQVYDFNMTGYMTAIDEKPLTNAIHIVSTNPVTVYGYSAWGNPQGIGDSPDGFLALPTTALGTHYFTVNFPDNSVFGQCPGEFLITSPYDGNTITINPASDTKGGEKAGVPWTITLNKGQTYLVQSPGNNFGANDLTGTSITSTRPISVLTGHSISSVPTDECCSADNLFEMIPSVDRWGYQYFDEPMAGKYVVGDYIRVLSGENGNQITYTGDQSGAHNIILDSGQYTDITLQTEAMTFTSTNSKKFIVAQYSYSQGYDGDPGYSDPWMVLFTPQQQFEKEMIFRTPTSTKGAFTNYLTLIARNDSINKIMINGLSITTYPQVGTSVFPGTNPVMGARRITIGADAKSFIAKSPVPFGAYQYGFSNYSGYGWPTGMAQGIISPDTLPPLMSILDSNCGMYHVQFIEPRTKTNGFSFDDTHIAFLNLITAAGDPRWPTPSFNYTFTPDPNFQIADSVTTGTLTVNDPTKDAYAAVFIVDLAGNDTVYQYHYYAPKISFQPQPTYDFGETIVGTDTCRTITVKNIQASGDFIADSVFIGKFAQGGAFSVTPTALSRIPAGDSIQLQVCFRSSDTGVHSIDTLYLASQCAAYSMPLTATAVTPLIYANDLNFGEVDSGKVKCKPLLITNPGKAPLVITAQDLVNDPDFSVDPLQKFPVVIPPGGNTTISFCFHPDSNGSFSRVVTFLNDNPLTYEHSIKDTALLTGFSLIGGARLTSYTKEFTIGCNDTVLYDTLFDPLSKDQSIDSVAMIGANADFFSVTSTTGGAANVQYPFTLTPDSAGTGAKIYFEIQYNPTKNGMDFSQKTATLQVYSSSLEGGSVAPSLSIQAQLVDPLVQIAPSNVTLSSARINQQGTGTFTITNSGNAPLIINSYNIGGADAGAFTFAPPGPITIGPGANQVVTVTDVGTEARAYNATFSIVAACNTVNGTLDGSFTSTGEQAQGTTHPAVYVGGCRENQQYAWYKNLNSNDTVIVTNVAITASGGATDVQDFLLASIPSADTLPPNAVDSVPVLFLPTAVGGRQAAITFYLSMDSDGQTITWTNTQPVVGEGVAVTRHIGIGSVTVPQQFQSVAANNISVPVIVDAPIEVDAPTNGTNEAYGYRFNISWKRDAFSLQQVLPLTAKITSTSYNTTTDMETRTIEYESNTPIPSNTTTLATLTLESMIAKSDSTSLELNNIVWLGQDTAALCYVSDTQTNATHVLNPLCGTTTLQAYLGGGTLSVSDIQPNPIGTEAQIGFYNPQAAPITITIYDVMGREVRRLVDRVPMQAGQHSFQFNPGSMPSGSYYCRVTDGERVDSRHFEIQK